MRILYGDMAHVNNKFEKKTKTGRRFHGAGIFFRQCRRRVKFLRPRIAQFSESEALLQMGLPA